MHRTVIDLTRELRPVGILASHGSAWHRPGGLVLPVWCWVQALARLQHRTPSSAPGRMGCTSHQRLVGLVPTTPELPQPLCPRGDSPALPGSPSSFREVLTDHTPLTCLSRRLIVTPIRLSFVCQSPKLTVISSGTRRENHSSLLAVNNDFVWN